jgi:hypothetical protein
VWGWLRRRLPSSLVLLLTALRLKSDRDGVCSRNMRNMREDHQFGAASRVRRGSMHEPHNLPKAVVEDLWIVKAGPSAGFCAHLPG